MITFWNGEFTEIENAKTSIVDRGYNFGDGAYDALTVYNGVPFAVDEHLKRLERSMKELEINSPYTKDEITDILLKGIELSDDKNLLAYFQITRGTMPRRHAYDKNLIGNFTMMLIPGVCFEKFRKGEANLLSVNDDRWQRCDIKSLNLLPNTMAATKAIEQGCVEALLIKDGNAVECTAHNVFRVKDGVLYTEPLSNNILSGITREHVLNIANRLRYKVVETHSTLNDYYNADEVFITSCASLILPINKIDKVEIGHEHKITMEIFKEYAKDIAKICGEIDINRI